MDQNNKLNLAIIVGSHRIKSNSLKITNYIRDILQRKKNAVNSCHIINLAKEPLPLWTESLWEKDQDHWHSTWNPISSTLKSSDAMIIVTPEWNGMVPAALKNFFLFCNKDELGHKPALIISVSSGLGGSYPIVELRSSSYKNNRICYLPEHIIIKHADNYFNNPQPNNEMEQHLQNRVDQTLDLLINYGQAFCKIRKNINFDFRKFANGM